MAIGDILGTVLADATIVVGILALISPFNFPVKIVYITGGFMVIASFVLFKFMKSGKLLSKRESYALLFFWIIFVLVEFIANR
jgi:Ca2+/Na+ antiporter